MGALGGGVLVWIVRIRGWRGGIGCRAAVWGVVSLGILGRGLRRGCRRDKSIAIRGLVVDTKRKCKICPLSPLADSCDISPQRIIGCQTK
jgi:hypothetical protein